MKKEKVLLKRLKVTSFVTTIDIKAFNTIRGGQTQVLPFCDPNQSQICTTDPQCNTNICDTSQDTCITGVISVQRSCLGTIGEVCNGNISANCNVTVVGCSRIC